MEIPTHEGLTVKGKALRKNRCSFEKQVGKPKIEMERVKEPIIRNRSEWKKKEQLYKNEIERYQILLEITQDGVGEQDGNRKITYINRRFLDISGYSRNEIIGYSIIEFLDDESKEILQNKIHAPKYMSREPYELNFFGKYGQKLNIMVTPEHRYNQEGNFQGSFFVMTNVTDLRRTQEELRKRIEELKDKNSNLEELNNAFKVILRKEQENKVELEERVLTNINNIIFPYIEKMKSTASLTEKKTYLEVLELNLKQISSSFPVRISSPSIGFTPSELQIANLIRNGRRTKEIGNLLNLSVKTIEVHRKNIRKKLGIKLKKVNLRTYLLSIL